MTLKDAQPVVATAPSRAAVPPPATATSVVAVAQAPRATRRRVSSELDRSILSPFDRKKKTLRAVTLLIGALVMLGLVVVSAGPLLWLAKAATSSTQDTLTQPFALWPSGFTWQNITDALVQVQFGKYLANTAWVALGSWFFSILVATTGGFGLSVLRPAYAKVVYAGVLATLFIPGIVSLVPLYLTVLDVPLFGWNLLNSFWAVWLPAGASAVNLLLVKQFFDGIPRDIFEAAKIDGAGSFRLFWSITLPLSKPILGVVSLLSLVAAYKEFLWPLLVLPDPNLQPLSVALPRLESTTELSVYLAALFISVVIPVALFLLFQKQFLRSAGSAGAIKG